MMIDNSIVVNYDDIAEEHLINNHVDCRGFDVCWTAVGHFWLGNWGFLKIFI